MATSSATSQSDAIMAKPQRRVLYGNTLEWKRDRTVDQPTYMHLLLYVINDSQYLVILQCGGLNILKFNIS